MKQIYPNFKRLALIIVCCLSPIILFAQTKIAGTVNDETKQPLPGVSVMLKGTSQGTTSDAYGRFIITASPGQVLIFKFLGFAQQEATVGNSSTMIVNLTGDNKILNEVVVTALGIKKETRRIGYAVSTVRGEDLTLARDPNPITGLIGKVAGLSVGPSAELLGAPNVAIRGNTISLYVVDGFPINTDTYNISPDDIESYTVLKGPAAAALYGNRASYGAILITTKKGNKGKKGLTVDINSSTIINKGFLAFPRVQHKYGAGENTFYEFVDGKGGAPGGVDADYDVWGPYFNGQLIKQYDSPVINGVRQATPYTARGANNLNNFLRTGYQTNNNVALSGNGDTYNVRFSASQQHQNSYIPEQYLDIANANIYASFNPNPRWKFEGNVNFNRQTTDNFPDVQYGPNSLIYNLAVWTGADWDVNAPDIKAIWQPGKVGVQSQFAEYTRYHNPWFMVKEWTRGHYKNDVYGYLSTNFKINSNLNATFRSQIDTYNILRTEKMPFSAHPYGREGNEGDYREDRRDLFDNNTELMVNYDYTIKKFLNLSGVVGGNMRNLSYKSNWTSTDYLSVPEVYSFSNSKNAIQATSFNADMRVLSAYYSLDATFGKYATVSSTGRIDKSSAFKAPTTYYYPSLSVATVISDYIKMPDFITFLKGRASFSSIRSDATSTTIGPAPFSSITVFGGGTGASLFNNPLDYGTTYASPYNGPDYSLNSTYNTSKPYNSQAAGYSSDYLFQNGIKTSTRVNYEEGFDIKFLQNRLGFSGTAFQYIDGPRILPNAISTGTGYTIEFINALKTKKTGYEGSLSGAILQNPQGFNWNILVNISTFKEVYKELPAGQSVYATFFKVGDRTDKLYGSAFVRTPDGKIINDAAGKPLSSPVLKFLGNEIAKYSWSIYNKFQYKSFSLGVQLDGSVGGVIVDYMHNKTMRGGANAETAEGALGDARFKDWSNFGNANYNGSFVGEGVVVSNGTAINYDSNTGAVLNYNQLQYAPNTQVAFVQDYVSKYYGVAEANLMSKTFTKLREVTFGFEFPKTMLQKTFIQKASVSIYGRNLLYFYKDKRFKDVDLDQYNYATASTGLQSPTVRSYGLNLNVSF
ncbi:MULTISPECIES: SusC/RagA family TonB-linked outer membrane protein [unclassified Mucilaginibacter]|uniref:SusC/RagA family TonB-linked outer membrane protein n=1 Tax=unclassified Mucilaginibacter TaxID=2617802 RepID=UPI002AC8AB04|nr:MULTISPECIES: SusC/RagA family TonB-linked outer membrane protein [unclassified Mucilaginibacter]MEB0263214.1 SusC/RagA family TonB-linked outer membrane protein [Mucilaginibacter sp. 10I4]MEB0278684.1 SusC/RagA family TonB-linked outer membrane protein [Mucilaginibacter sp. 10B2]MEB0299394.1 SusC/RagA family TonB-linked outer membrane protein [Mucilaginibacter sp. 5C4]WPX23364.1 SusC/RagA family TonB-linked outer membrane protein [Mucilaginibacter sp. 5C4]